MEDLDLYRCRLIYLKQCDDPKFQAVAACDALLGIDGILLAAPFDDHSVHIIYSLNQLSFELITDLLGELNFELDNSILISLRNTIYCYLEDNARENMHIDVTGFQLDATEGQEKPEQSADRYWEDYR